MKNYILLSALLVFACSSDDSNNNTSGTTDNSFNPPNWIQDVWLDEDFPIEFGYEFRHDNIYIINSSQATCYKYCIDLYQYITKLSLFTNDPMTKPYRHTRSVMSCVPYC